MSSSGMNTVKWAPGLGNPYSTKPQRKAYIEALVKQFSKDKGLDDRGAHVGIITTSEHEGGTKASEPNHVTTEFKDANGNHITTRHVAVPKE